MAKLRIHNFAFGPSDAAVLITEMPDNESAAAIALAFAAGGALRNCQTTALMTNTEALSMLCAKLAPAATSRSRQKLLRLNQ